MRNIKEIIVHCTATKEGANFNVKDVYNWHVKGNGWNDVGYHYLVLLDGTIERGRDESKTGAHCSGRNLTSIGVCYVGGLAKDNKTPKDTRTEAQKKSLVELLKRLKAKYPKAKIYGHRDFSPKACPCFDAKNEYKDL